MAAYGTDSLDPPGHSRMWHMSHVYTYIGLLYTHEGLNNQDRSCEHYWLKRVHLCCQTELTKTDRHQKKKKMNTQYLLAALSLEVRVFSYIEFYRISTIPMRQCTKIFSQHSLYNSSVGKTLLLYFATCYVQNYYIIISGSRQCYVKVLITTITELMHWAHYCIINFSEMNISLFIYKMEHLVFDTCLKVSVNFFSYRLKSFL